MGTLTDVRTAPSGRARLDSIDLLRGLVMVIMALDHVRDYCHHASLTIDPVDLRATNTALFLTRWITHFCAPTFVFLAGTGAFLSGSRGKSKRELSWFLFSRGLWLVLLELTLVRLGWDFHFDYIREFGGGVIWVIGWSMVVMSGLVYLPTSAIATVGVMLVAFHNLWDGKHAADVHLPEWLWMILHDPKKINIFENLPQWLQDPLAQAWPLIKELQFVTGYSLLPWLGVMAAGYGFGSIFLLDRPARRRQLLGLGIALIVTFVALRYSNLHGDPPQASASTAGPGRWSPQDNFLFTVFAFVNCNKYPPSLMFLLMTLGPGITLLGLFDRDCGPIGRFFVTYGRVPLFYYLLHIPLIHGVVVGLDYLRYGWSPFANEGPWALDKKNLAADYGYNLPTVYLIWAAVVLLLYPLCYWFAGVKRRRKDAWLSYL